MEGMSGEFPILIFIKLILDLICTTDEQTMLLLHFELYVELYSTFSNCDTYKLAIMFCYTVQKWLMQNDFYLDL